MRFAVAPFAGLLVVTHFFCTIVAAKADSFIRKVALTGQTAPGTQSQFAYTPDLQASLNNLGQTAFAARLTGSVTMDTGAWVDSAGTLSLIVHEGMQMPDGTTLGEVRRSRINDAGKIGFSSFSGYWSNAEDGEFRPILDLTTPPPGVPSGAGFSQINGGDHPVAFNNHGRIAFQAHLVIGLGGVTLDDYGGIWSSGEGTLSLVARQGFPAAGGPPGALFYDFMSPPPLNDEGQTAFSGVRYTNVTPGRFYQNGVWVGGANGLRAVALGAQQAPGAAPGAQFNNTGLFIGNPRLNSSGQTAFTARLQEGSGGVTEFNDAGVWSEGSGSLQLVAREGSAAPGTPLGVMFGGGFNNLVLNNAGHVAFTDGLFLNDLSVGNGLWSDSGGSLALVVRDGSPAPGAPAGAEFSAFQQLVLNGNNQLAFLGSLKWGVAGVTASNDRGIWAENIQGILTLIAREGDQIDVDDGPALDLRTISELEFVGNTGNGDGYASGFNNLGQIAFSAQFTDGSQGIFVSNLAAVPEPGTALLTMATLGVIASRRRS